MNAKENEAPTDGLLAGSNELLAHCCLCHSTFPESDVLDVESGGDECPKCHEQGVTICLDGEAMCACGEGANAEHHARPEAKRKDVA